MGTSSTYNLLSEIFKKNYLWGQMCTFGLNVGQNCASLLLGVHFNSERCKWNDTTNIVKSMKLGIVVSDTLKTNGFWATVLQILSDDGITLLTSFRHILCYILLKR